MSPELLTAVKERVELGHSLDSIREEMRQAGHADEVIEAAIAEAKGEASSVSPMPTGGTNPLPGAWMLFKAGAVFMWQRLDLVAAMAAPLIILVLLDYLSASTLDDTAAGLVIVLSSIIGVIIYLVLSIAALYVATKATERRVTLAEALTWTREHFWALVWVYVLISLAVWGGFLLLIIPGIILSLYLYFALYVFVVEDVRGFPALLRSRALVWGHWWHLFWRLLGLLGVFLVVFILLGIIAGLIFELFGVFGELTIELLGQIFSVAGALIGMYVAAQWYHAMAAIRPPASAAPEQMPAGETKYKVLTWLGVVALLGAIIGAVWVARTVDDWSALDANTETPSYEAKDRAVELRETDTF